MKVLIIIPVRYKSSRFPGKPLADIHGKTMIQHVYEKATMSTKAHKAIVATDDIRILSTVRSFSGEVIKTSPAHQTGTDRVIEVSEKVEGEIYINVQGDEPLIRPDDIDRLIGRMSSDPESMVATLCHQIPANEAMNTHVVKVVRSTAGKALYFSRSPIPHVRDSNQETAYLKHVGIYGFRKSVLAKYKRLPHSALEHAEKLEQLRILEAGIPINILETNEVAQDVDTPDDLEIVKILFLTQSDFTKHNKRVTIA